MSLPFLYLFPEQSITLGLARATARQAGMETTLCGSVWLHGEWRLLEELRAEIRGAPSPQRASPPLCRRPGHEGLTELSGAVPTPGLAETMLQATRGRVLPAKCPQGECARSHQGTRLLSLAQALEP